MTGLTGLTGSNVRRVPYDRASLVDVAVRVFLERGYDRTSMEDLARAAGITKSSFYHHVEGKEELLRAACDRALDRLFALTAEESARTGRAVDRFEHLLRRTTQTLVAELPYVTLLLRVRGNTAAEQHALERRREFDRFAAGLVTAAAADGDLRADIDPPLATRLVFGLVNSISEWYRAGGDISADDVCDAVVALVMRGLLR